MTQADWHTRATAGINDGLPPCAGVARSPGAKPPSSPELVLP